MNCHLCTDRSIGDMVNHVRLMHPDHYDPGIAGWPVEVEA